jgi:hypothetical protein
MAAAPGGALQIVEWFIRCVNQQPIHLYAVAGMSGRTDENLKN